MDHFFFVLLAVCITCVPPTLANAPRHVNNSLEAIFWEVKPFIYEDKNGEFTGILPRIFERAHYYCSASNWTVGMVGFKHKRRTKSYKAFKDLMYNHTTYQNQTIFEGMKKGKLIWAPIINHVDMLWATQNNYDIFNLLKVQRLAVIVRREDINLVHKFCKGIQDLKTIIVVASLFSCIFAVCIWLSECRTNDQFPTSFIRGFSTAFWFCIVSMTTVGYGDVLVRTPIGRYIALHWLLFGVLLTSICTATLTTTVTGLTDHIYNKRVSVLESSFEAKIAEHDYHADIVNASSYEEVIELVRRGEVDAGVMLENITAWYQSEIIGQNQAKPEITVIKTLPANVHVLVMVGRDVSQEVKRLFRCMFRLKEEIYYYARDEYNKHLNLEVVQVEHSLYDMVVNHSIIRLFVIVSGVLLVLGLSRDIGVVLKEKSDFRQQAINCLRWILGRERLYGENVEEEDDDNDDWGKDGDGDVKSCLSFDDGNVVLLSVRKRTMSSTVVNINSTDKE